MIITPVVDNLNLDSHLRWLVMIESFLSDFRRILKNIILILVQKV